jgi:hypothetical protein
MRLALYTTIAASIVTAQNANTPQSTLPPPLQQALERIQKDDERALRGGPVTMVQLHPGKACSVPLLQYKVEHPEQFTILRMPPPPTRDPMASASVPAPPCDVDNR